MDAYFTIERPATAEFKDRGSRFIAFAFPISNTDDFKNQLQKLKKEHPKAVNHCFAWRLGLTGDQFRVNDDGEPSGTAGKPILAQIDSKQVTNTAVIVVRYFGGTLLGVPGLINAYKTVTSLVLQMVPLVEKPVLILYSVLFDYTAVNQVMQVVKQFHCQVLEQDMQLFSHIKLGIPKNRLEEVLYHLGDIRNVELKQIL